MARVRGTASTGAVLLAAHYDSAPEAPGAADDGAGVAAILEAVRALRHHPPLRNDLIVVFTDGEEKGLLGARLFVRDHRWVEDVALVLDFEARGNTGPSILFETSAVGMSLLDALLLARHRGSRRGRHTGGPYLELFR